MDDNTQLCVSLPCEAVPLVWRLLGVGESPLRPPLSLELTEQWIRKVVSRRNQAQTIDEIRSWFHEDSEQWVLRNELRTPLAMLILDTIEQEMVEVSSDVNDDRAFWAIGSIEPDLAENIIRSQWDANEIQAFGSYVLGILERLCKRNQVIDPERIFRLGGAGAEVTVDITRRRNLLRSFKELRECEWWLHPGIRNVVALLMRLAPELLVTLLDRADHPVVQRWAAECAAGFYAPIDPQRPLEWIRVDSSDAAIALGIVHTLENVAQLDADACGNSRNQSEQVDQDKLGSALLSDLLDQLSSIQASSSVRWIVDLLSYSVGALPAYGSPGKPERVQELEELCIRQLASVVRQRWSTELSGNLRAGLRPDPLVPRNLPFARVAWEVRGACPAHAAEIARMILEEHEERIVDALEDNRSLSYLWDNWTDHDSILGLAISLVILGEGRDSLTWVLERCERLPLSVWDAEDSADRFREADEAARVYFVAAFCAVQILSDLGDTIDPALVNGLAERLWDHGNFVAQHTFRQPKDFAASEHAARVLMELGQPSKAWLLEQVDNPAISPRILWALIEASRSQAGRNTQMRSLQGDAFRVKLLKRISSRYGNSHAMNLDDLGYLAKLWLLLQGATEAKQTALNILALGSPKPQRTDRLTALELLAFAASKGRVPAVMRDTIDSLYRDLWSGGTPREEIAKRKCMDDMLGQVAK